MQDHHAPHDEFVARLEARIGREVRRRNSLAPRVGWLSPVRLRSAAGVAALVVISMAIGGAVVAAAYEAQAGERRDALSTAYAERADLARQRFDLARQTLRNAEQQVSIGLGNQDAVLDALGKVADADAQVKIIALDIEEIHLAAREPLDVVSSPLVSGRDFVTERWKIQMTVPQAVLETERTRLQGAERRVAVGVATAGSVDTARARVVELEAGVEAFQRKIDIRRQFLAREIDAPMADLRVIESEAEQRRKALVPKVDVAKQAANGVDQKLRVGLATQVEREQAQVQLLQLQTELAQVDVDLAVVRRKIAERRGK